MREQRKAYAYIVVALALGACSRAGAPLGVSENAVVVCQGPNTVEGIDVSEFQGNIDWNAVKASGRQFAFIRVSDGTYQDPKFDANWAGAKAAGVLRGAYQFFEPADNPITIADQFLARMGTLGAGDLPPVLDVETTGGQSAGTIRANMEAWLAHVQAATGRVPFIYVSPGFWPNVGSPDESHYRLWVANWQVNCPNTPTGWSNWEMWQYADNGSVSGIAGAVDLDRFNGSLQQLNQIGGGADWAAQYVGQSWPLASTALAMKTGQTVAADITMRNVGSKTWDGNTRLGTTQPRDRSSLFADGGWPGPNRAAQVAGTVPPGGTWKFAFNFHAPSTPGSYHEFFSLVQEGVAWFSDPGQGGPADNQIEAWIDVTAPDYSGEFVAQSFPGADKAAVMIGVGQTIDGWVDLKNVGSKPWVAGTTKLAPTPRDMPSSVGGAGWLSPTRVSTVAADVAPGAVGHFPVKLTGGSVGDYSQTFALVEEGVTWFADAGNGGGPPDNFVRVHVIVTDNPQMPPGDDAGMVADMGSDDGGSGGAGGRGGGGGSGTGGNGNKPGNGAKSGCSFAGSRAPVGWPLVFVLVALAARRWYQRRRGTCTRDSLSS
jgi:lysozyme